MNILLVDDDDIDVMNVQRAFRKNNIISSLYIANNGIEAISMLRPGNPESIPGERRLVLLDLNMPKMGGLEFLEKLRQDPLLRTTPVIVLTTSNEERDRLKAYELHVAGYILKPIIFSKLTDTIVTLNAYWMLSELP